ncbi:YncE family protein [Natribacillus halophilus]|uniref:40-residue YVTN family beta-propeller repeat-containing protein n=1 Tax=Natribacillus halophilus TaxID=549003 RepID=A0A1G8LMD3_9BACI|nr:YncE family protein [Natribacillus halophilus]SDI56838.1 40-residue YVTN family beta-propeller repeat-containing protein [Natribacillus halophilus]
MKPMMDTMQKMRRQLFYDAKTNELIKEVDSGAHPAHIVFTENNQYALVTNTGNNNVPVIDMKTYEVVHTISTGNGPHGLRISADSKFAYIANMNENTVSVIDLGQMKETKKIIVGKCSGYNRNHQRWRNTCCDIK